jgi:hypothetical protein
MSTASPQDIGFTHIAPVYPPSVRMSCACCAVMRIKLSRSAMFAVSCASCDCRCEIWRGFCEGIVLIRDVDVVLRLVGLDMLNGCGSVDGVGS